MAKLRELAQCKHPNSRKTLALTKKVKKEASKKKQKLTHSIKQNLLGEKIIWFRDNLPQTVEVCTAVEVENLITRYLERFNEELKQIQLKHSIGNRKNRQHASREDIINMTIKREMEEFSTCGLEVPDILDLEQIKLLRAWNGELRYLPNFRLQRISKKKLEQLKTKQG